MFPLVFGSHFTLPHLILHLPFHLYCSFCFFCSLSHLHLLFPLSFFSHSLCLLKSHTHFTDTYTQTHVIQCQAGMKADELSWLSLSLMRPVSFTLSGHSHRLVRAKVMPDSFSQSSSRIDWACLAQSNHVNLLVVTAFIEKMCDMAGKRIEWPNEDRMERVGGEKTHLISKQVNE